MFAKSMPLLRSSSGYHHLVWTVAFVIFVLGPLSRVASAQQTHTLDIRNGTVYVDGRALSDDQLPDSLNLDGMTAQYRFLGIQRPVIELKGRLYAVDDGLRPVTEEEVRQRREAVVLRGGLAESSTASGTMNARFEADDRQYLDAVQRTSRDLYERLVRERRMEQEARELARAIRLLPQGAQRQARIDSLRVMLHRIFDLKQENRRREIRRLEQEIREIEKSIQEREEMRQIMIERRLQHLIDTNGRP